MQQQQHDNQITTKITKLTIEMVPKSLHGKSLRLTMPRRQWDKVRIETLDQHNNKCAICKANGPLDCHETYEYNNQTKTQILTKIIPLCKLCHYIKHIGLAFRLVREGKLTKQILIDHFTKVNDTSADIFNAYHSSMVDQYLERSSYDWSVDFGEFKHLLNGVT